MQTTAQRFNVPAGFSGHWCTRCEVGIEGIPEEAGNPAKCPRCRHYTVFYIPTGLGEGLGEVSSDASVQVSSRDRAGEERRLKAGVEFVRKMPTSEDAKRLFDHMKEVIENPDIEPDLRKLDDEAAKS